MEEEPVHSWSRPQSNCKVGIVSDFPCVVNGIESVLDFHFLENIEEVIVHGYVLFGSATVFLMSLSVNLWHVQIWLEANQYNDLMGCHPLYGTGVLSDLGILLAVCKVCPYVWLDGVFEDVALSNKIDLFLNDLRVVFVPVGLEDREWQTISICVNLWVNARPAAAMFPWDS